MMSNYTLMHKDIPVVEIEFDGKLGVIINVCKVHNIKHTPLGVKIDGNEINKYSLNAWLRGSEFQQVVIRFVVYWISWASFVQIG